MSDGFQNIQIQMRAQVEEGEDSDDVLSESENDSEDGKDSESPESPCSHHKQHTVFNIKKNMIESQNEILNEEIEENKEDDEL